MWRTLLSGTFIGKGTPGMTERPRGGGGHTIRVSCKRRGLYVGLCCKHSCFLHQMSTTSKLNACLECRCSVHIWPWASNMRTLAATSVL